VAEIVAAAAVNGQRRAGHALGDALPSPAAAAIATGESSGWVSFRTMPIEIDMSGAW